MGMDILCLVPHFLDFRNIHRRLGTYLPSVPKLLIQHFCLKADGRGDLFLNTFGAIVQKDLQKDERMIIDNHHIVALSENSNYTVKKFGGLKSTLLGREGLVTEIIGPGSVYFQTKNINDFVDYLGIKEMIQKASSSSGSSGGFRIGT